MSSSNNAIIPNFFIVGAAKAGTTSLWAALKNHPQVFMAGDDISGKEPCYFVDGYGVSSLESYLSLFSCYEQQKVIGDASAAHLSAPESAKNIHDFNPDAKILIVLRNPADRAYSLYCWMVQEGYDWVYPFERAVLRERARKHRSIPNHLEHAFRDDYMYFSSGMYYSQVKRYFDLFGKNVKVIIFEELIANSQTVLKECLEFIGIDYMPLELPRDNPSTAVLSPKLQWLFRMLDTYKTRINYRWPRDYFVEWGKKNERPAKMNSITRTKLLRRYQDDMSSLAKLINKDLTIWRR